MKNSFIVFLSFVLFGCSIATINDLTIPEITDPTIDNKKIELECTECDQKELQKYFKPGNRYVLKLWHFHKFENMGFFKPWFRNEIPNGFLVMLETLTTFPKWRMLPCVLTLGILPGKTGEYSDNLHGFLIDTKTQKVIELSKITAHGSEWVSWLFLPFSFSYSPEQREQEIFSKASSFYLKEAANLLYHPESIQNKWKCNFGVGDTTKCLTEEMQNKKVISYSDLKNVLYDDHISVPQLYRFKEKIQNLTKEDECDFVDQLLQFRCEHIPTEMYDQIVATYNKSCGKPYNRNCPRSFGLYLKD